MHPKAKGDPLKKEASPPQKLILAGIISPKIEPSSLLYLSSESQVLCIQNQRDTTLGRQPPQPVPCSSSSAHAVLIPSRYSGQWHGVSRGARLRGPIPQEVQHRGGAARGEPGDPGVDPGPLQGSMLWQGGALSVSHAIILRTTSSIRSKIVRLRDFEI